MLQRNFVSLIFGWCEPQKYSEHFSNYGSVCFILTVHTHVCSSFATEQLSDWSCFKWRRYQYQACDTEPSGDFFSGDGTRLSLQSNAKSSSGYHSSSSTNIFNNLTNQCMCVGQQLLLIHMAWNKLVGPCWDLQKMQSKWPNLCFKVPHAVVIS